MKEYVNKITMTAHTIKELNFDIKEKITSVLLLSGLPDEYQAHDHKSRKFWHDVERGQSKVTSRDQI